MEPARARTTKSNDTEPARSDGTGRLQAKV